MQGASNLTAALRIRPVISANRLCLLAAIWVVALANRSFWRLLFDQHGTGSQGFLFPISLAVALVGVHLLLFRLLSPARSVRWILSILLVIAAATGWFMDTYGVAIDSEMLRNVVQTDPVEASAFLGLPLAWRLLWQAAIPIAILWRCRLPARTWFQSVRDYAGGVVAGLALALLAGLPMFASYASFLRNQDSARYLVTPANVVVGSVNLARKSIRAMQPFVQVGEDARRSIVAGRKPLVVVLVVGETARAANFSLGGYGRETNPLLKTKDVFYFTDVRSCGTATAVSVPCMFSDLPRDEFKLSQADHRENVLDILQRSGLAVSWIDNQSGCKGVCVRVPTRTAAEDHPGSCENGECHDDALLFALDAELGKDKSDRLIVLHAMGSHGPAYYRRVPPDQAPFQPICPTEHIETCTTEQIVNAYDNSIHYTDFVLAGLIDRLAAQSTASDTVLLYVSDHGESLGEKGLYLHGQPYLFAPDVQTRVPLLMWISEGARARFQLDVGCLKARLAAPASHDNVAHTLLGFGDVHTRVYRPGLDLLRACRPSLDAAAPG